MKIAISGKGGVGKTLVTAFLCHEFVKNGHPVLAIDADPDSNLATSLYFKNKDKIIPISEMKELIQERTGTKPGEAAPYFKLNPRVDDIPGKYAAIQDGIRLMIMGRIKRGGSGCYCPENALLQALLTHLLLRKNEIIILDMEAGIEHLSRGTARMVNQLLIVVEPGRHSIETAGRITKLANDIGLENIALVGNKIRSPKDIDFLLSSLPAANFMGFTSYDPTIAEADISGTPIFKASTEITRQIEQLYQKLLSKNNFPTNI